MIFFERITELWQRIQAYSLREVAVELAVIALIVYLAIRFVKGTRAAGALRGIAVLVAVLVVGAILLRVLGGSQAFPRLAYLTNGLLQLVALMLVVVFQPELRRALIRLGEAPFWKSAHPEITLTTDAIVDACAYLSKARFGALIVIERQVGLQGLVEGGTELHAKVSARLIQTIFFPGSALHDLAMVIRGDHIHAAGVQLPLAEPEEMPDPSLGSRHRAAVGLTRECDALVVIVSEETGRIRLSERGTLSRPLTPQELREELITRLTRAPSAEVEAEQEASPANTFEGGEEDLQKPSRAPGRTGGGREARPAGKSRSREAARPSAARPSATSGREGGA